MVLVLLGCAPCDGYVGTTFVDADGLLGAGELDAMESALDEWLGWVGDGRVCLDRVEITPAGSEPSTDTFGASETVNVPADVDDPVEQLLGSACYTLGRDEELAVGHEDWFPTAGSDLAAGFAEVCLTGPPEVGWYEDVAAACGSTTISERDQYLVEVVYPNAPRARRDGAFDVTAAAELELGVFGGVDGAVQDGDTIAMYGLVEDQVAVWRVDPATGDVTEVVATEGSGALVGGPDGAVWIAHGAPFDAAVPTDGSDPVLLVGDLQSTDGAVSAGRLYLRSGGTPRAGDTLQVFDLETGEVSTIPLPEAPAPYTSWVASVLGWDGGIVAVLWDTTAEDETILGYDAHLLAWSPEAPEWRSIADGLWIDPVGIVDGERLVGTWVGGAEPAVVAYDLDDDQLLVSPGLCADVVHPELALGAAWYRFGSLSSAEVWAL